jgi:hypothetical protein
MTTYIDWDDVRMSNAKYPVVDLWVEFDEENNVDPDEGGFAAWRAGAEMTNYSGALISIKGWWLLTLEMGDMYRIGYLGDFVRGLGEVVCTDWNGREPRPNPRTILALQQILQHLERQVSP